MIGAMKPINWGHFVGYPLCSDRVLLDFGGVIRERPTKGLKGLKRCDFLIVRLYEHPPVGEDHTGSLAWK